MIDRANAAGATGSRASLKAMLVVMLIAIGAAMALLAFGIHRFGQATQDVAHAHETRYSSYLLADELRQSSDDLTRLARTYVVSGDPQWERQYQQVVGIRNGSVPRPALYHRIYWDFRAAGQDPGRGTEPAIPLEQLMKRAGFTDAEFAKLRESEASSNELVRIETIAMNMVKGQYDDGKGGFTRQAAPDPTTAQAMMHDAKYHAFKAKIMQPLDEFFAAVDLRTSGAIAAAEQKKQFWYSTLVTIATLLVATLFGALWLGYRQLARSLNNAVRVSNLIAGGNLDVAVEVQGPSEVAQLLRAMGTMRDQLVRVVGEVRRNADSVAAACADIAQGNSDLSARTEEQASALEQTAASMEELSSTVHRNADNAEQANQLAQGASTVAVRGGEVVGRVVGTMKDITESSRRI